MKQKGAVKFLLPVALLLWGYIGLKVVKSINKNENITSYDLSPVLSNQEIIDPNFELFLDYPNPFANSSANNNVVRFQEVKPSYSSIPQRRTILENQDMTEEGYIEWPSIEYLGMLKKNSNGNESLLIMVNGESGIYDITTSVEQAKILAFNEDSITLLLNEEAKTFYNE